MDTRPVAPKMSRKQAMILWKSLSYKQQQEFNEMHAKLLKGDLILKHVRVDDNEEIQNIVLDPKDPTPKPDTPFYKHFK